MTAYIRFGPLSDSQHVMIGKNASNASDCPDGIQWIYTILGDCVITQKEYASALLGLISMVTWMLVGVPQIIKNFRNLEGLAGISPGLLLCWTGGDSTNLIGSLLTHQLQAQIYLAIYFVASDCILVSQYVFYRIRKWRRERTEYRALVASSSQVVLCITGLLVFCHSVVDQSWPSPASLSVGNNYHAGGLSRSLLSTDDGEPEALLFRSEKLHQDMDFLRRNETMGSNFWHDPKSIGGYVVGVISSILYLGSRTFQIVKNFGNKSTSGLAIMTFLLAVVGNITYGGQILVRSLEKEFLLEKTPWLVGSLGVIGLDVTLLSQFYYYNKHGRNRDVLNEALLSKDIIINADGSPPVEVLPGQERRYRDQIY